MKRVRQETFSSMIRQALEREQAEQEKRNRQRFEYLLESGV